MKFIIFVEGHTEHRVIAGFLKRWLDPRLSSPVGISPVKFSGWAELVKDSPTKAGLHLTEPKVIAVISLLDLYGPTFYPHGVTDVEERYEWGKKYVEKAVDKEKFFHSFAVHEIEAWLLSDPLIFPPNVRTAITSHSRSPETVNHTRPPSKFLNDVYERETGRRYKKLVFGERLFKKLNPEIAYAKCPHLKALLDKMLDLAEDSGH